MPADDGIASGQELDFEPTEESAESEALPSLKYEIFSYPADTTLKGYLEQWNNDQLVIPEFQRDYIWDQTRASKLIESFLLGLPVPPVFLYKWSGNKSFWVIDGNQRIHSIVYYLKGFFGENRFRLKNVETIDEISPEDKFNLETSVLRAVVIQQTNPRDHSSIYHIFERLNTGGIRLSPMEVRQCVYASAFLNGLKSENLNPKWRGILGLAKRDKRLKDVELILRIISLYLDLEHYEKPMKGFLNDCASRLKELEQGKPPTVAPEAEAALLKFRTAVEIITEALGIKPFHLKSRLNFSALDAVFVTVMRLDCSVQRLKDQFPLLVADAGFIEAVSFNTSDERVVESRLAIAANFLR